MTIVKFLIVVCEIFQCSALVKLACESSESSSKQ